MMKAKYCGDTGCLQRGSVEREEYAGAPSAGLREGRERDGASSGLLESILDRDNLNRAYKRVKVVGFAKGILMVLNDGQILDTILHASAQLLGGLPSTLSAVGMYLFQCLLNFLVPAGSGQAAISLPILAPLGDMVGVTRQTACIAFQLGDGISNIFSPTSGYFMAGLAIARVPWGKWAKWVLPLILLAYLTGLIFVVLANVIQLGPF